MRRTVSRGVLLQAYQPRHQPIDGSELPKDLYIPKLSADYPPVGSHWQPAIRGAVSPYRGKAIVVGDTIPGVVTAILFAQRGWQVGVVRSLGQSLSPTIAHGTLLSKRSMDILDAVGLQVSQVRTCGVPVKGFMDSPGSLRALYKAPEETLFGINVLSVDSVMLRDLLVQHAFSYPHLQMMTDHKFAAIFEDKKEIVIERDSDGELLGEEYDVVIGADGAASSVRETCGIFCETTLSNWKVMWGTARPVKGTDPTKPGSLSRQHVHTYNVRTSDMWQLYSSCEHGRVTFHPAGVPGDEHFKVSIYAPAEDICGGLDLAMHELRANGYELELGETYSCPLVWCDDMFNHKAAIPNVGLIGAAAHSFPNHLDQMLALELEDAAHFAYTLDRSGNRPDAPPHVPNGLRKYSKERGVEGDCLYKITRRAMYYNVWKNLNIALRARVAYAEAMHELVPRQWNEYHQGSPNHLYPRSVNTMLNARGYASYHDIDQHQLRTNRWFSFARLL
eukprot:PhM_4_TR3691/c0_g1_i1/m.80449/K00486/KMO; kynurenine 3-monooxygenase